MLLFIIHSHFFFGWSIATGYYAEDGMKMTTPVLKNNFTLSLLNCLLLQLVFWFFFLSFFSLHFSFEGRSVRFCLKGSCFRVVTDLGLSFMGSITYSVKTVFYTLCNNRTLSCCAVLTGIMNTSILKGGWVLLLQLFLVRNSNAYWVTI